MDIEKEEREKKPQKLSEDWEGEKKSWIEGCLLWSSDFINLV